jgi:glycerophosphoryl diester phosphodiesterase
MTNLTPQPLLTDVPQLELKTKAQAGPGGPMNEQAQALLNRIEYLLQQLKAGGVDASITDAKISPFSKLASLINEYSSKRQIEMIAHRGFSDPGVQNTMFGFSSAIAGGATSLECDVQISSDGIPVTFHDDVVSGLTNGNGSIAANTYSTLASLVFTKAAGTIFGDVCIPKFAELCKYAAEHGVRIYPEIKGYRQQSDIDLMATEVYSRGIQDNTVWQAFNLPDLVYLRSKRPDAKVGYLRGTFEPSDIDTLKAMGNAYLLLDFNALLANPAAVTLAKAANVKIAVWTVQTLADAKRVMALGVNAVMGDFSLGKGF